RTQPVELRGDRLLTESWRFRAMNDLSALTDGAIKTTGLAELRLSGSASLHSPAQMEEIKKAAGGRHVVVLDLREESHAIAGDHPVTWIAPEDWGNVGKTTSQVLADEKARIEALRQQEVVSFANYPDLKHGR